jgi:hypothetical protein
VEHDAEWARRAQRELRALLNDWDPIGILGPDWRADEAGPVDEYDCLRDPLISRLLHDEGREEVAGFLQDELADHFGFGPGPVPNDVTDRIFEWWETVR